MDVISSVSGGSFTSAYFGLYGDRIFEDYEQRFLRRNVQGELTDMTVFSPTNWFRLASPSYGRSDLATEFYDDTIFDHATFGDLEKAGGPFLIINATEMTLGARFQFTQSYFNLNCGDLSSLPVARAVTASSAVPVLFSPVTLVNRAGTCGWKEPAWVQDVLNTNERTSRLYNVASNMRALEEREQRPYLHLLDGGLADNLGLRTLLDSVLRYEGITEALKALNLTKSRKIIVLLVNAETVLDVESSRTRQLPSFSSVLNAATSVPLQRYSFETVALVKGRLEQWEQQTRASLCDSVSSTKRQKAEMSGNDKCGDITFDYIEVYFSEHPDPEERDYLFDLPDEAIDRLIDAGGLILRNNRTFRELLKSSGE